MATEAPEAPQPELVPPVPAPTSIPQKRAAEDDHSPAVSSPLNPEVKPSVKPQVQPPEDNQVNGREKRTKKESLKKRESKGVVGGVDTSRATPDPAVPNISPAEVLPLRYKLAPPRPSDFEPARESLFISHHETPRPDGDTIEFLETSEQ
jgi:COMPASS component BRE2